MARKARPDLGPLEARIGHAFANPDLIERALTHVSALSTARRGQTYQRLEFLGDRVLGLAVAEMLFETFPKATEGEMSQRLADLVRREACADVAAEWGASAYLWLGGGEAKTGGSQKAAILGDVCESIIGAVFLDAGYGAARELVRRNWSERMLAPKNPLRDPKTVLQEWAQARGREPPNYREVARSGPDHAPHFTIAVELTGYAPAQAEGASKRAAEQAAARAFMAREKVQDRNDRIVV